MSVTRAGFPSTRAACDEVEVGKGNQDRVMGAPPFSESFRAAGWIEASIAGQLVSELIVFHSTWA